MKRVVCLVVTVFLSFVGSVLAQERSNPSQEKIVRETYRKLEIYNAAAQVFDNERTRRPFRSTASLKFELRVFRAGSVQEILNKPYAELVTMPTGDVVSLTRGGHSQDGGPQEATFAASWEHGQYASVFDPGWTVADVFHFEAARYYDIASFVFYRVLALFRESPGGPPEFWDAIVNGVASVWEEKRPPYKAKNGILVETSASIDVIDVGDGGGGGDTGDGGDIISDGGSTETLFSTTSLGIWDSEDDAEHASGRHLGTAQYTGICSTLQNKQQRCSVGINNFVALESGTLSNSTPFFWHVASKDQKTESRTGALGTTISCAAATGEL